MPIVNRPRRQVPPRNRGSVSIARSSIDNLMPQIQEQNNNALAVNAYPSLYYSRKQSGLRCSCSVAVPSNSTNPDGTPNTGHLPLEPGVSVLNPDGSGTEPYLQSMLQGASISIDRYGSRDEERKNPQRSVPHSPLIQSDNLINKSGSLDDPFADEVEPTDPDDLFNANGLSIMNDQLLTGNAAVGCGVCLGSNWVGGYDLLNGSRQVLDVQAQVLLTNIEIGQDVHPNVFRLFSNSATSIAQFEITLPVGAVGLDCIRLWNNKEQVTAGFRFEIYLDDLWQEVTEDVILNAGDGLPKQLRVVMDPGTEVTEFTHLEVQLDLNSEPLYVEYPKITESQNLALPENLEPVQLLLSPLVPTSHLFDIIADTTYERPWLITNVTNNVDRERAIQGWEVTARLVQRFEYGWMLYVRRVPHRGDHFARFNRFKSAKDNNYTPYKPNKSTAVR